MQMKHNKEYVVFLETFSHLDFPQRNRFIIQNLNSIFYKNVLTIHFTTNKITIFEV